MTQRAVCSFPNALFNLCSFVPTALKSQCQANRLRLPRAICLKPSLNSRRLILWLVALLLSCSTNGCENFCKKYVVLLTKSDVCVILAYLGKTHLVFII